MAQYVGWALDQAHRAALLAQFPPAYRKVVADHVTLGPRPDYAVPADKRAEVVGQVDDGHGVQALVVRIDGTTDRPDGSTYHLTWSLGDGRKAVESNDVIRRLGWTPVDPPRPIRLTGKSWPW